MSLEAGSLSRSSVFFTSWDEDLAVCTSLALKEGKTEKK
jgi:hypothetical protein